MRSINRAEEVVVSIVPVVPSPVATLTLERDLEAVIMAAARGDDLAKRMLRPVIRRLALDSLTYIADAENVISYVLASMAGTRQRVGAPLPGRAVQWLENVVRASADHTFEETGLERWEEWDPPGSCEEEEDDSED